MAESFVQLGPDGTGKQIDTFQLANGYYRQTVVLGDPNDPNGAVPVSNGQPQDSAYGAYVRLIGEDNARTQTLLELIVTTLAKLVNYTTGATPALQVGIIGTPNVAFSASQAVKVNDSAGTAITAPAAYVIPSAQTVSLPVIHSYQTVSPPDPRANYSNISV